MRTIIIYILEKRNELRNIELRNDSYRVIIDKP